MPATPTQPPPNREVRTIPGSELRLAQNAEGKPMIVGYAAVFNSLSLDLGGFRETIRPGAFDATLEAGADVRALVDHLPYRIIGRNKAGTLRLLADAHGLKCEIDPPDTSIGRDTVESLRRGDVDNMSFGFFVVTDDWRMVDGEVIRELIEVSLDGGDVSVVTYPAYPDTQVAVRSLEANRPKLAPPPDPACRPADRSAEPTPTPLRDSAERSLALLMAELI